MVGEAGFENMGSDGFGRTAAGPGAYGAMAKGADPVAEEMKRLRQDVKALRGEIARLIQVLKKTPPASDAGAGDASTEGDGGFGFPGGTNDFEPGPGAIESDAGISDPGVGGFDSGADEGGTAPDPASSGYGPALVPDATGGASPGAGGGSSGSRRPGTSRSRAGSTPVPGSSLPSGDDVGSAAGIDSGRGGDSGSAAVSPERSSDNRPSLPQKSGNRRKERTVPLPNFDASAPEGGAAGGALDELPESGAAEGAAPVRKPPAGSETEGGTSADPGIDLGDEAGST